jgi:TolB-like protein
MANLEGATTMTRRLTVAMLAFLILTLLGGSPALAQDAPDQERPLLIVLPLEDKGVGADIAGSLTDLLVLEVERVQLFTVLAQQELRDMLNQSAQRQLMGVESDEELAAVGAALKANLMLRGSVGRVGATYLLTLSLIDVKQARAIRRVEQRMSGDPDGLLGSLHSAVLSLALEEKGVAPDLTASMIDSLNIARKPKTLFVRLGLGYETPVGPTIDSGDLAYMLPELMVVNLSAGYMVKPYFQLVFETGVGLSIAEQFAMQNKLLYLRDPDGADADGKYAFNSEPSVNLANFDYQTMRVPLNIMARFQPKEGRLLPFAQFGLGFSWQRYSVGDEHVELLYTDTAIRDSAAVCPDPYTKTADGYCQRKLDLTPLSKSVDYFNLQVPVSFGVDYLLSANWGIGFELRYLLTYSLNKDARDLDIIYSSDLEDPYPYGQNGAEALADTTPIRRLNHSISVLAGFFYYY